ncbi:MAG: ATP-binding cassette domain-containing protein, partial [SAR324 cluster bacterium]|nr:ATP-binding cassette domain-containing protein [SAR324 cluster bacterium]
MSDQPLVEVENLNVDFPLGRSLLGKPPMLRAVNDVSLKIMPQTFFGLVGESGSGKTTLGRAMLRAAPITSGTISFNHGNTKYDVGAMSKMELKEYRKKAQLIFQDPYAALNPRMTVRDIIAEPLEVMELVQTREEADQKVREIASKCRLNLEHLRRFP